MKLMFSRKLSLIIAAFLYTQGFAFGHYCSTAESNPYIACIQRYVPSACSGMTNGCNPAQIACLERYVPSVCEDIASGPGAAFCTTAQNNPYMACLEQYVPSACTHMTNGCNAGQVACLERYLPKDCE